LQGLAALLLAEYGTADASESVLEWLDRKLGRKARARAWDPYELPSAIRFSVRHTCHASVARIIVKHWTALDPDERDWLSRTWPALNNRVSAPYVNDDLAPPTSLQSDVYEDERGPLDLNDDATERAGVLATYARASQRKSRAPARAADPT
jgi:hypothetical protein